GALYAIQVLNLDVKESWPPTHLRSNGRQILFRTRVALIHDLVCRLLLENKDDPRIIGNFDCLLETKALCPERDAGLDFRNEQAGRYALDGHVLFPRCV